MKNNEIMVLVFTENGTETRTIPFDDQTEILKCNVSIDLEQMRYSVGMYRDIAIGSPTNANSGVIGVYDISDKKQELAMKLDARNAIDVKDMHW